MSKNKAYSQEVCSFLCLSSNPPEFYLIDKNCEVIGEANVIKLKEEIKGKSVWRVKIPVAGIYCFRNVNLLHKRKGDRRFNDQANGIVLFHQEKINPPIVFDELTFRKKSLK